LLLDLKTIGWGPASRPTNRRTELFADWIEAQALIAGTGDAVSKHEIVDRLEGTSLVVDSDDGWRLVEDAFSACRSRRRQIGEAYPFALAGNAIELAHDERLAYLFCLLVSLPEQLQALRTSYPTEFRDIFEQLVAEALRNSMPSWHIYSTGWSAIAAEEGKGAIVAKVGEWTLAKQWDSTVFPNANDAQVDIAAVRPFGDTRSAFPVMLGQCATGVTDWKSKACRPNLDRWQKAVQFSSYPTKLFAVPFALDDKSFWEATVECSGFVLDRTRLCMSLPTLGDSLRQAIDDWMGKARQTLPLAA
jgi:hypothetical protein